ncbi:signal-regulatory protein beta-2-like [Scomber scombrus]|uniref:signal-regulatory protein beta-2-like n=1 Tax=Scomber scombrus TaxID=13677 RepID=UPI002DDC6BC2|nr:signal-regulatory protein beta-2-like [Scomber scombrus]
MLFGFYILLMFRVARCADDQIFVTETVGVGHYVTLTCTRQKSEYEANLYWIRLIGGNLPEFMGGTFSFDYDGVNKTPRITTKQQPGKFVLHINKAELSDTGLYYCIKVDGLNMTLLKGTFLRIEEPESDIIAVTQDFPSDPVHPGDSVTLQCSVLSDSKSKRCPEEHNVYWFRAGSDESHPSFIYVHGNVADECGRSPEARSPQKCVYSFSKTVSSSDAGTYYCAVATCGEVLFGNGTRLDIEVVNLWDLQKANIVLPLLCAALAASLIVIGLLIYSSKKKSCDCCNAALQTNLTTASNDQQSQQRNEDSLVYSVATFTSRKVGKAGRRNVKASEGETIYNDVRAFVAD